CRIVSPRSLVPGKTLAPARQGRGACGQREEDCGVISLIASREYGTAPCTETACPCHQHVTVRTSRRGFAGETGMCRKRELRGRDGMTFKPRTANRYNAAWFGAVVAATLGVHAMVLAARPANVDGAIFTTTRDGSEVNENTRYPGKAAVYLNGGPQN